MNNLHQAFNTKLLSLEKKLEQLTLDESQLQKMNRNALAQPLANFTWYHVWIAHPQKVPADKLKDVFKKMNFSLLTLKENLPFELQNECDDLIKEFDRINK